MNCIYYCFYGGNEEYLKLLTISLKSLNAFFNKENVYVFCDRNYPDLENFCNLLITEFPDGYAIPMAYRLVLGKKLLKNYDNVLHLDIDTLVVKNIDNIFNLTSENEISFASENGDKDLKASIDKVTENCWAGPLLSVDEIQKYKDIQSICCGVFLFNKSISPHLEEIYKYIVDVENTGFRGICRDQHAFTTYLVRNRIFNFNLQKNVTHLAQGMVAGGKYNLKSDYIIYHFAGGVTPSNKLQWMRKIYDELFIDNEYDKIKMFK